MEFFDILQGICCFSRSLIETSWRKRELNVNEIEAHELFGQSRLGHAGHSEQRETIILTWGKLVRVVDHVVKEVTMFTKHNL